MGIADRPRPRRAELGPRLNLTEPSTGPSTPSPADSPTNRHAPAFELGLALAFQFLGFLGANIAAIPYIGPDKKLKPGPAPIFVTALGAWPVFIAGIAVAAYKLRVPFRRYVGALTVRWSDGLAILAGVVLQVVVGVGYRLAGVDDEKVSAAAKKLTTGIGSVDARFILLAITVGVGAPIVEELFYRGFVLNGFRSLFAPLLDRRSANVMTRNAVAIGCSAIWFGLIHFQLLQLPALVFVGVACGIARVSTGRISTAICLHAGFNLTTVVSLAGQLGS